MKQFSIRSAVLLPLSDVLQEFSIELPPLLEAAGVPASVLQDFDTPISYKVLLQLFEHAVSATGCEHFGLLLGERGSVQTLGVLGLLLKSSPSFGPALEVMIEHLDIHAKGIIRRVHREGAVAWITTDFEVPAVAQSEQAVQMSVATMWKVCELISHHQWHPRYICFEFSKPADAAFYRRFFRVPVVFDADFNGVVFAATDLELRLQDSDPFLHQEMRRQARKLEETFEENFVSDVKRLIIQNMDVGVCSEDAVVRFFPFQKRTFQSRLQQEGVSYQTLLDDVRFQKAEFYLSKSRVSVTQLAELLCYKSSSVFSTAFKRRYGVSPLQWRTKLRN